MIDPIDATPQINFPVNNLPPNTEDFYNTKAFARNETSFLSTMVSMYSDAQERGNQALKDAINGLT
jgi:hypothetical protein